MANSNSPFGFRPLGLNNANSTPSFSLIPAKVAAADTAKLARGDGCQKLATGYVSQIGAAGVVASQWAGIFWGCSYLSLSQGKRIVAPYWPGGDNSGDVDVLMIPLIGGANMQFLVQSSGAGAIVFADKNANVDIAYAAPTVLSGTAKSGVTILKSTVGTTATLPFRIEQLYSEIAPPAQNGTDDTAVNNLVVVSFNGAQATGI